MEEDQASDALRLLAAQLHEEAENPMNYDDFQRDVQRRKRERWAKILASEPPGRVAGRRPRDPDKERILLKLDRARLARVGPQTDSTR